MPQEIHPRVFVSVGDITEMVTDAIVNAANTTLLGGGGVDGAIHRVGGPAILDACRLIRQHQYPQGLPTGEAVVTTGGRLPAKAVIHTVGPIYGQAGGHEPVLLANCYRRALQLVVDSGWQTVAFPAISTGVYGYPEAEAARIASRTVADFLVTDKAITEVHLVFYRPDALKVFCQNHQF